VAISGCSAGDDDDDDAAADDDTTADDDDAAADDDDNSADDDDTGDDGTGDDDTSPPFTCDPVLTSSPHLAGEMYFDPAEPHPGDTLTVIVQSTNGTSPQNAPSMSLQAEGAGGVTTEQASYVAGGGETLYYYDIEDVRLGDICVLGLIDGSQQEISGKITVTERPAGAPLTHGVFKVVENHQWTCGEQPTWGNEVLVRVLDENGQGMGGVEIDVHYADSTDYDTIHNGGGDIPDTVFTGGDGTFHGYNYWPISDHGFLVFQLSVRNEPSDIATELTTGWWEDNGLGCNYCNTYAVNTWGHWSYTVTFQRDTAATEICVVDNDHAGQSSCGAPGHLHHDPAHRACWNAQ